MHAYATIQTKKNTSARESSQPLPCGIYMPSITKGWNRGVTKTKDVMHTVIRTGNTACLEAAKKYKRMELQSSPRALC